MTGNITYDNSRTHIRSSRYQNQVRQGPGSILRPKSEAKFNSVNLRTIDNSMMKSSSANNKNFMNRRVANQNHNSLISDHHNNEQHYENKPAWNAYARASALFSAAKNKNKGVQRSGLAPLPSINYSYHEQEDKADENGRYVRQSYNFGSYTQQRLNRRNQAQRAIPNSASKKAKS